MTAPLARGRPRSTTADLAIQEAALALFADLGYDALSIEAVAEKAGVARSTVYRRYPGKAELIIDAVACARADEPLEDTGSLEDDLFVLACRLRDKFTDDHDGRMIPALSSAAANHPDLSELHRRFIGERRRRSVAIVERGVTRGELAADTDVELFVDLLGGTIYYHAFVSKGPLGDEVLRTLVRQMIRSSPPA